MNSRNLRTISANCKYKSPTRRDTLINRFRSFGNDNWHIRTTHESSNVNYIVVPLQPSRQDDLHYHTGSSSFVTTNGGVDGNPGRGSGFPRLPIPSSYPGHPFETPFKATPGCESVVVVKIPEEFPREIRAVLRRMLSRVLSRLETSPFRSSFRLAPSPFRIANCETYYPRFEGMSFILT